jgi:GT2 family glycosyltransferase
MRERGLAVVVVAYGVPTLLAECLAALGGDYPVIVVDNSSSADVRAVVSEAGARSIDPGRNLGFAAGVNRALDELDLAVTDVLLLNPDSTIDPASIDALRTRLAEDPRLACVAPAQRQHVSSTEDRVAWPFPTPLGAWIEALGLGVLRRRREFAIGAVLLLRGEALVAVGGFDERFFLYAEETDWQQRAARLGWGTAVCDEIWATHVGAATDGDAYRRELRFHTGAERYIRKHHGRLGWMSYRLANLSGATARAIVLKGERRHGAARRARIYACGPDRVARKAGAVPPPVPRVPELGGCGRGRNVGPPRRAAAPPRPPLRILLDARDVGVNRNGVARVLEEVVPRLMQLDPERYVAVTTPAGKTRFGGVASSGLRTVRLYPNSVWEQLILPLVAAVLHVDLIYSHRECAAIWGPPVLLHVTEDPEAIWEGKIDLDRRTRVRRAYSRIFMDRSLQRVRVVTSTESTRADLMVRHGVRSEQVSVVALGVDRGRFNRCRPRRSGTSYLFCLTSADPRDHCELVIEAFARFHAGPGDATRLVIAGDLGHLRNIVKTSACNLGVSAFVDLPGRVSDEELAGLYASSLATICASSHEGFGLQPLEALASGSLLIAARTPAVEEVTRGAVVVWADLEADSLAAAMSTAVRSSSLRDDAAKTNPAVAAQFDWSTTATVLHGLLEEAALARRVRRKRRVTVIRTGGR